MSNITITDYKKALVNISDWELEREYNVQKDAADYEKLKAVEIELSYRNINL